MSDPVQVSALEQVPDVAAAPVASKALKKNFAQPPRVKKPKVKANRPTFAEMVAEAIVNLKERLGSSRQAIIAYIASRYNVPKDRATLHVKAALKKGEGNGVLKRARETGKGAGRYKVVAAAKKKSVPKKIKKVAAKKPAKKVAQNSKAKKIATKKPAAKALKSKGKKVPKKSAAAKKPVAKKSAPKKPLVKKMAAKKSSKK